MLAHGRRQFELGVAQSDGRPLRDHLLAAARAGSAVAQERLRVPPCPAPAAHVWEWFCALHAARGSTGFGPAPIRWADLEAFFRLRGIAPRAHELEWLRALDDMALEHFAARSKKDANPR